MNRYQFQIFAKEHLSDYFNSHYENIKTDILHLSEKYILNVNKNDYIEFLKSKYSITKLIIDTDNIRIDSIEKSIPADRHPSHYNVRGGGNYLREGIKCYIPFSGNNQLLNMCPTMRPHLTIEVTVEGQEITFELINWECNPDEMNKIIKGEVNKIKTQLQNIDIEIDKFHNSIEDFALPIFNDKKQNIINRSQYAEQIGIPIKRRSDTPETFAIPVPEIKKKIEISKPKIDVQDSSIDPTLDNSTYISILKLINDVGKQLERMPSVYEGKDEPTLRDFILLILEPNFEGSATGETFNKSGKTDILLRYENSNAFIAECKYWSGEVGLLKAIDQLLGYLTWRDSKSAIVLFVKNESITKVLEQIPLISGKHRNFIRIEQNTDENWFNIIFHINDDPGREVKTAILLYHVPPKI